MTQWWEPSVVGEHEAPGHHVKLPSTRSRHSFTTSVVLPECRSLLRQQIVHHVSFSLAFVFFFVTLVTFSIGKSTCLFYGYANISRLGLLPLLTYYIVEGGKERQLQSISLIHAVLSFIDMLFAIFFICLDNYFDRIQSPTRSLLLQKNQASSWVLDEFYRELRIPFWYRQFCILLSFPCLVQGLLEILLAYLIFTLKRDQESYYQNFTSADKSLTRKRSISHTSFMRLGHSSPEAASTCFRSETEAQWLQNNLFFNDKKASEQTPYDLNEELVSRIKSFRGRKTRDQPCMSRTTCCLHKTLHQDEYPNTRQSVSICPPRQSEFSTYLKDRRRSTFFSSPFVNSSCPSRYHDEFEKDFLNKDFEESTFDGAASAEKLDIVIHRA